MCNPMAFAMMQAGGQYAQGRAADINAQSEADALQFQGRMALADSQTEARRIRRAGAEAGGQAVAAASASGVKVGEGSTLDVERQIATDYATDEYMAILTGKNAAAGLEVQASNTRRAGRGARRAAAFNAATSLLSAGAQSMRAGGWRSNGPGFAGTQMQAPIESRNIGGRR